MYDLTYGKTIAYLFQDKEANLDIVMDKMRQDATEGALKVNLNKALEMLDKIKDA